MKIIGLTGGIGSGKSIISNILLKKGIPVYNSDKRAKFVMLHDSKLKKRLITTRVMLRDKCSEDVVRKKMKFQWKDEMKINLSDYVVHNNELDKLEEEAISLISFLMKGFR